MPRTITVTEEEEVVLYNAIWVAERYARGKKAKAEALAGMKVALRLGFPYKHETDGLPAERS